jgi:hypothetical protein
MLNAIPLPDKIYGYEGLGKCSLQGIRRRKLSCCWATSFTVDGAFTYFNGIGGFVGSFFFGWEVAWLIRLSRSVKRA